MNQAGQLIGLSALALLLCLGCSPSPAPQANTTPPATSKTPAAPTAKPNVVLISIDTLRADRLGCYGNPRRPSPNIDTFFESGIRFTDATAQAPWTLPSHMSMFTSMMPSANGVDDLSTQLRPAHTTLAEQFASHSYETVALVNDGQMKAHWGLNRGFKRWEEFAVDRPEGNCESITKGAVDYLAARTSTAPFFLFLHYFDTHDPYDAPLPWRQKMEATYDGEQAHYMVWRHRFPGNDLTAEAAEQLRRSYDAELAWLDHELGKLFAALPPNTMVVLMSDHGEAFDEHGWTAHGATLYQEELHVPLLVRLPEAKTGQAVAIPVSLLDVAPSMLAWCGLPIPKQFTGRDLSMLLINPPIETAIIGAETKRVIEGAGQWMARKGDWKLVYSVLDSRLSLFRLPAENKNELADQPAVLAALLPALRAQSAVHDYWLIYANDLAGIQFDLEVDAGAIRSFVPLGFDRKHDQFVPPRGPLLQWAVHQHGLKAMYIELTEPNASMGLKLSGDGDKPTVVIADTGEQLSLPIVFGKDIPHSPPIVEQPFAPKKPGVYIRHIRGPAAVAHRSARATPDAETIRQLRSLGYMQ